ncbi:MULTISPECIES: formate/nitrite transporter family protein [Kocuria]|uniref:formate/nitrite transporter family protein n=1 Tax=Kocuria TaxID=57493 RepID=UPI0006D84B93|nr:MULTISPECIES: formate/nitrite transporter family protein [Kocuria]MDN5632264.1 formate/nitrite transporter family protein [Kocuria sp.]RUP85125.1 formate/nitrite transporter family protein [Kocuria sp. HSID17590]RUQ12797.1 formate/nitrite transporter family protein [Kocuria sp. HSID17582]
MAGTRDSETARRSSGRTDQPLEDELVDEFENTVQEGTDRLHRTWRALVVTGLFGGIDVGLGIMAMLAVMDATGSKLLAGMAFGIGLLALRLAHSELFTEDFLLPLNAVVAGHGSWWSLLRLWIVTLVANLVGGWAFMWVVVAAFPDFSSTLVEIASGYVSDGFGMETVCLALLAGSTITLMTRMQQGTNEDMMTAVISLIGGLLVVGLGMLHGALNSIVVFGAMHTGWDYSYLDWLGWFAWVIPLNMVGGMVIISLPRLLRTWELLMAERRGEKISDASSQDA